MHAIFFNSCSRFPVKRYTAVWLENRAAGPLKAGLQPRPDRLVGHRASRPGCSDFNSDPSQLLISQPFTVDFSTRRAAVNYR
jgi:hypothetical protein